MKKKLFLGIDAGSSRTKAVLTDENKKIAGYAVKKSGVNFSKAANLCLTQALSNAAASVSDIKSAVFTGYGRNNIFIEVPKAVKTEISCHAKGCYAYFPYEITVIDIGGQDNKLIKINKNSKIESFKMNRKCAAGTGAFLEEMALRLDIPVSELNNLAEKSENMVKLGSFCTVFSATEVLENIQKGVKIFDIAKGIFHSVIKRVFEMDSLTKTIVITGGVVAHNPFIIKMATGAAPDKKILTPALPQFTGAFGAALYASNSTA
ncbi:MAG: ATPase [Deltaproteobacteria bacterium]|nr:ATPase [Deltaproteobacteria bacterium]